MNLITILIFLFLIFISLLPSEILKKTNFFKNKKEFLRKLSHFFISFVFILTSYFLINPEIYLFSATLILSVLVAKNLKIFKTAFDTQRKSFGVILFPFSLSISTFIFLPQNQTAFIFGMFVLAFSDSLAAVLGKNFGKKEIIKNKTYVGSFAFFISTFFISLLFLPSFSLVLILKMFFISFFITLVECSLKHGLDNIFIPLFSGLLFVLLI